MNDKKKIIMGFRLKCGQAILENGDQLTVMDDPAALAQHYSDQGADHLYIRDLSETDAEHEEAIGIIKEIARISDSSVIAGGNVKRLEPFSSWTGRRALRRRSQRCSQGRSFPAI